MKDLKLKAIANKVKMLEKEFWDNYKKEDDLDINLIEQAITIIRLKGNIIRELERKNCQLEEELICIYENELNK